MTTLPGRIPRRDRRRHVGPADPLRVVIVAESFLPAVNGVTNSVLRAIEHLRSRGHEVAVIAPGPGPEAVGDVEVRRVRSFDLPRYDELRIGLPGRAVRSALRDLRPDVIHAAAPTVLGLAALRAARRDGVPTVAVFQTDIAGFARRHGLGVASERIWAYLCWVHTHADRTLAPASTSAWALRARGLDEVSVWARGVDLTQFHPDRRDPGLRRFLGADDELVVGYVGRLAREKQVDRLRPLTELAGVRVVVVGDGPERRRLERLMPAARFVGFRQGDELAAMYASIDTFVHTGVDETFCQCLQEAMASGVACVAPSAGGPLDLVAHRRNGLFWSPEIPETLVGAVAELRDEPRLRERLGRQARDDVEARPWPVIMDQLIAHYRDVVRAHSPQRIAAVAA